LIIVVAKNLILRKKFLYIGGRGERGRFPYLSHNPFTTTTVTLKKNISQLVISNSMVYLDPNTGLSRFLKKA
jgi:hypothetical protein